MNRIPILLLSLYVSVFAWSQEIMYQPVFISQCSGKVETDCSVWMKDVSGKRYHALDHERLSFSLPRPGTYWLHYFFELEDSVRIDLTSYGVIRDTFYAPRIAIGLLVSNPPSAIYEDCQVDANGTVTDLYRDGKIRMTGKFKDGHPVDTLREFYLSGSIRMVTIYGKCKRTLTYYEDGHLKEDYNLFRRYQKLYYPSGQILLKRTWDKKCRSRQTKYLENGNVLHESIPLDG